MPHGDVLGPTCLKSRSPDGYRIFHRMNQDGPPPAWLVSDMLWTGSWLWPCGFGFGFIRALNRA